MNIYALSLLGHITGLTMMAATVIITFMTNRRFWKLLPSDKVKATALIELNAKFPILMGLGMLLLIISGVSLLLQTKGVFAQQLWFKVKMALLALLVVNAIIGRRLGNGIKPLLALPAFGGSDLEKIKSLETKTNRLFAGQLVILIIIFTLAVFKFN